MALDDSGLGIPVPDDDTADYELKGLVRDALNALARILAEPAPAPQTDRALLRRLAALEQAAASAPAPVPYDDAAVVRRLAALETAPAPVPYDDAAVVRRLAALETAPAPAPAEDPALRRDIDNARKTAAEALRLATLERKAD